MLGNPVLDGDALTISCGGTSDTLTRISESAVFERFRDLQTVVDGLLASWVGDRLPLLPRSSHRVIGKYDLAITPLDDETLEPTGDTRRVQAWDLSPDGLSFTHRYSLACRTVAVTIPLSNGDVESIATQLKWCRFSRDQLYRSGGQFLRMVNLGIESGFNVDQVPPG